MSINPDSFGVAILLRYLCLNEGQNEPCPLTACLGGDDDDGGDDGDDDDDDVDDDDDEKYDINLTMPPDANTLHAASQEHTQFVTAIV